MSALRLASAANWRSSLYFFFSSRRRHTRYWRDWSSDVCSSDLGTTVETLALYRYFAARARPEQVVVVTDPGTPLEALARRSEERRVGKECRPACGRQE